MANARNGVITMLEECEECDVRIYGNVEKFTRNGNQVQRCTECGFEKVLVENVEEKRLDNPHFNLR